MSSWKKAKETNSVAKGTNGSWVEDERLTPGFPKVVPHGTPVVLAKEGASGEGRPVMLRVSDKER